MKINSNGTYRFPARPGFSFVVAVQGMANGSISAGYAILSGGAHIAQVSIIADTVHTLRCIGWEVTVVVSGVSDFSLLDVTVLPVPSSQASGGTTGAAGRNVVQLELSSVTGFAVGDWVRVESTGLVKAQANTFAGAFVSGVIESINGLSVTVVTAGTANLPGVTLPEEPAALRLSVSTAGAYQTDVAGSGYITELGRVTGPNTVEVRIEAPVLAGAVANADMAPMPARTIKANLSESSAAPADETLEAIAAAVEPLLDIPTGTGEGSPTVISALDIDFAAGTERFKNIAANSTFTLSNVTEGRRVRIDLNNTSGSSVNVTFTGAITPSAAQLTLAANTLAEFELVRKNGVTRARVVQTGYAVDTTTPTLTHSIDTTGLVLTTVSNEPLEVGMAAPTNFSLTNLTPSVTLSSYTLAGDRLSFTHAISRAILGSETPQITIGASNGIRDVVGNQVGAVTGGTVTNGSTVTSRLWKEDFEGSTAAWMLVNAGSSPVYVETAYATSPAPLVGTKSGRVSAPGVGTATRALRRAITTSGEVYIAFRIRYLLIGGVQNSTNFALRNGGSEAATIDIRTDGSIRGYHGAGYTQSSAGTYNTTDTAAVFIRYKKATGAGNDGILDIRIRRDGVFTLPGSSTINKTDGTSQLDITEISFESSSVTTTTGQEFVIDEVDVSTEQINSI